MYLVINCQETTKKLVHWDSGAASGGVFGSVLGLLVAISYFSLISVAAYIALAALAGVMAIKVYSFAMVFLKKVSIVFIIGHNVNVKKKMLRGQRKDLPLTIGSFGTPF